MGSCLVFCSVHRTEVQGVGHYVNGHPLQVHDWEYVMSHVTRQFPTRTMAKTECILGP